ncbi:MAG TPA: response regulator [Thermoanaerobaculia bacterium]|nr:response regulator [Thermoanaerobaculia bacterium]
MAELTVLIVDDEAGSRSRIRNLLKDERDVTIAGECADGDAAVEMIRGLAPSLVFLDIQMPGIDGFEVLRRLDPETMPLIIFVTAFDQYAVDAFEVRALDYLVKPVRRERFAQALQRARELETAEWRRRAQTLVNRVVLRTRNRILLVPAETIDWIEAAGNYARVHVGAEAHLLRETMSTIEERLDPKLFVRTHRRAIVNVERIREVVAVARGEYSLLLHSGARVPLSRACRARLEFLLGSL